MLNHKAAETLLAYFAADVRRNVRVVVLQLLGAISAVAPASVTRSMALVLPPLLCADILAMVEAEPLDAEWLMFSAVLLTCSLNAEQDGTPPIGLYRAALTVMTWHRWYAAVLVAVGRHCSRRAGAAQVLL